MQAELEAVPLIPQQPRNFPAAVNTQIISRNSPSHPIQSFQFTSAPAGSTGPVYRKGEARICRQRGPLDLAFEFREAGRGAMLHWQSPRVNNPRDPLFWQPLLPEVCFIKALVTGSRPDSVIYVKSIGRAPGRPVLDYAGYVAEMTTRVGSEGVVCLEYRCNQGQTRSPYQTHLQFITLTGRCRITSLSPVLRTAQDRCTVHPNQDSSQEQNFCVPHRNGVVAGLYRGRGQGEARSRCLAGDNNLNKPNSRTTNLNPAVRLICR